MSTQIKPINLIDVETGNEVECELLYDPAHDVLQPADQLWVPYLHFAVPEMRMRGADLNLLPDNKGWVWAEKLILAQDDPMAQDWRFFGLRYKKQLQGIIVVSTKPEPCKAQVHRGEQALGVEFLAAAPWNIGRFMRSMKREPFLDLVGPTLMRVAIALSQSRKCEGRLYLYSVPKAEYFYRNVCGMIDLGLVDYHGEVLRLFEMTREQAKTLAEGK